MIDKMEVSLTVIAKSLSQSSTDMSASISLGDTPNCAEDGSGIFAGTISSSTPNRTLQLYNALSSWYTNSPVVLVDNTAYSIDQSCQLLVQDNEVPTQCAVPTDPTEVPSTKSSPSSINPTVVWAVIVGIIVALIVIVVVILIILFTVFIRNLCINGKDDIS